MSACRKFANANTPIDRLRINVAFGVAVWSAPASSPFDGTDAAGRPGRWEWNYSRPGVCDGTTKLVAPATVFNFGLNEGWEAVFEGHGKHRSPKGQLDAAGIPEACPAAGHAGQKRTECLTVASCFRTVPAIRESARVWRASSRSDGIGKP
jgi:hypothetical protein